MVNDISTQATEIINNQDDKLASGMSLGTSSPEAEVIEMNSGNKPRENYGYQHDTGQGTNNATRKEDKTDYEPLPKEDTTNYEQLEYEISYEIEKLQKFYESIDDIKGVKVLDTLLDYLTDEEIKKATGSNNRKEFMNSMYGYKPDKEFNEIVTTLKNAVKSKTGKQLAELRTLKDSIYSKWDRRTDEQKREDQLREKQEKRNDSAYQRAKEDLIKAGYNPAMLSGVNYGGGGGSGGSSKADEEERKRLS